MTDAVSRRRLLAAAALGPLVVRAQDKPYAPTFGQPGKDVMWAATPDAMVERMLLLAGLKPSDFVIDLGAGDGKIVIASALAGARGLGIEYNPDLVALARQRAQAAGVADRARFEKADIFESDFSRASIVTLYLLPRLNLRLRHRLLALTPGTRIVSHSFDMGDWRPDETTNAGGATAFLWLVPANVGGDWALRFPLSGGAEARGLLVVDQRFQQIGGAAVFRDFTASLRQPLLAGDRVRFALTDAEGHLREFDGRIAGRELIGTVKRGDVREPFHAERTDADIPPIGGSTPVP
ncbi:methyltransferase domain-containing protein [Ottowia testudinis]|uniref:Methyltransferase domain-containing protein n=1 Tax=Ottowia testudinis TaxID=2816950 RepID=A0A975H3V6_9BURK|nr:methyltransferase domain-containing protein [Ottowia testudinis]QTD45661.1 methyltransferase domain-containing protein [Ottowia testudinis]